MKIYFLEDNDTFAHLFGRLLTRKKIKHTLCSKLEDYKFEEADVYIIDLQLGMKFSYEAIKDIRSKTDKPIAILSHHREQAKIKKAIDSGANYIMNKYEYELYGVHLDLLAKM